MSYNIYMKDLTPHTVTHYISAQSKVFKKRVFVPEKYYQKFSILGRKLNHLHVPSYDFSLRVSELLKSWVDYKCFTHVPINTYCSDRSIRLYAENEDHAIAELNDLLDTEIFLAQIYIDARISNGGIKWKDVVQDMRGLVSKTYIRLSLDDRLELREDALVKLCNIYGIRNAYDYEDIAYRVGGEK